MRLTKWLSSVFPYRNSHQEKIFCIGLGKTGTTSLEQAFKDLRFRVGNQKTGELLIDDWARRDFRRIIGLCKTADAFQDVPFCLPYTFQALDAHFDSAKFILTVRNSAVEWYDSLTRFHSKMWADGCRVPSRADLEKALYLRPGYVWRAFRLFYNTPDDDPYNRDFMLTYYDQHVENVRDYFRHRPGKLLEINVSRDEDYFRLCEFLGRQPVGSGFPWLHKT